MACPRCGAEVRAGQKFCAECGLALSAGCPNCGAPYEGNPKFCAECGTALPPADAAEGTAESSRTGQLPAAERRYVSVLFADLVGFTQLSEQHDPEEVRDLLSRYFDLARQVIVGYGGSVEKFIGDAVMAIWGAPVAREDDPERAVRAALELVDRVRGLAIGGQELALRAAVLSGEAAVTPGRTGEGMVAGDLVNTASRLQSIAQPGAVLVGESTYRATQAAIAYEPAGEQLVKGKSAPVEAWRALRVVARRGGEGREEGLEPPFVGRDEELRLLKDQLHTAEREHKLRVVAITGQAGLGKSRLVWELEKYLDGLAGPTLYYWHQGRSPSYGEGVTFWALGEMVRRRARIAEGEDAVSTRAKLRTTLEDFVPDPEERRWLEPALGALLGIDEADWDAREQLFSAWRTFIERIADRGPTVLVFEDLQWADDGLLDFIDHLLDWTRERPILMITLARPELLERRPNFGLGHRAFTSMRLEQLPDAAMEMLLRGLVPQLSEADLGAIVGRAEGVPLYAVETVRALVDRGHLVRHGDTYEPAGELPALDVPPTLLALIASRLDALEPGDRALLQDAAVLGLVFSMRALAALTGRQVRELETRIRLLSVKELVVLESDPRSPERGQYRFMQGLIREVAYGTLARRERRARHLSAARFFETLGDEELAAMLANHYVEAYRAAPEGDEGAAVAAQARVALRAAAERASRLHSHDQAIAYAEQALAVTFDAEEQDELRLQAANSAFNVGRLDKATELLRAAIEGYEGRGSFVRAADSSALLGGVLLQGSHVDEGMSVLDHAIELLPNEPSAALALLFGQQARGHMFRDRPDLALEAAGRGLDIVEKLGHRASSTQLLITKAWALSGLGRRREAISLLIGAMQIADDEEQLAARTRSRFNLSSFLILDDPHRSAAIAAEAIAIARQFGLTLLATNASGNAGTAALVIGDLEHVLELEHGVAQIRNPIGSSIHGYAAAALALRGDADGARQRLAIVEEAQQGSDSPQDRAVAGFAAAMVTFANGELTEARRAARETREIYFEGDGVLAAALAAHVSLLLGDLDGARQDRDRLAQAIPFNRWVERSVATIDAGLLALAGDSAAASTAYRRVTDDLRAADLRLDLALALLERERLLGQADGDAAEGHEEARTLLAAMGAEGLLERLEAGGAKPAAVKRSPALRSEDAAATRR